MLKPKLFSSSVLVIALAAVAPICGAQGEPSPQRDYDLYSWKIKSDWHYRLVPAQTAFQSIDQITLSKEALIGTKALEKAIRHLPRGSQISWMSDSPSGSLRSTASPPITLMQPSRMRIKRIRSACHDRGITLSLR
jgi:hypothetical protein